MSKGQGGGHGGGGLLVWLAVGSILIYLAIWLVGKIKGDKGGME
jgi:heme exporter protein D